MPESFVNHEYYWENIDGIETWVYKKKVILEHNLNFLDMIKKF